MDQTEIAALAEGMVPFVREVVADAVKALPIQKGEPGETGPQGPQGPQGGGGDKGERGDPGRDGRDAADLVLLRDYIKEQVTADIAGRFNAVSITSPDSGRTLRWAIGDTVHEIKTAIVLDAGVWKEDTSYAAGDGVTLGGSFFIAQTATLAKPGKSDDWRLAVKRGIDGRDARAEREPEPVRFR